MGGGWWSAKSLSRAEILFLSFFPFVFSRGDNFSECPPPHPPSSSSSFSCFPPIRATRSEHRQWTWWKRHHRLPAWHKWSGYSDTWHRSCTSLTGWTNCWPWSLALQGGENRRKERARAREGAEGGNVSDNGSEEQFVYCLMMWPRETWTELRDHRLTRESLASLQHLLYVGHHDPLYVLQLCVDAAQIPPRSAVNVWLLRFLDVGVWWRIGTHTHTHTSYWDTIRHMSNNLSSISEFRSKTNLIQRSDIWLAPPVFCFFLGTWVPVFFQAQGDVALTSDVVTVSHKWTCNSKHDWCLRHGYDLSKKQTNKKKMMQWSLSFLSESTCLCLFHSDLVWTRLYKLLIQSSIDLIWAGGWPHCEEDSALPLSFNCWVSSNQSRVM